MKALSEHIYTTIEAQKVVSKYQPPPIAHALDDQWLHALMQEPALSFGTPVSAAPAVRIIRLDEINEERHQAYRQALANVYAALDPEQPVRLLYLLDGGANGVALYFGVVADAKVDLHEAMKNLRSALEGQLPGINFGEEITAEERGELLERLRNSAHQGVMLGTPSGQTQDEVGDEQNFQGVDRLLNSGDSI